MDLGQRRRLTRRSLVAAGPGAVIAATTAAPVAGATTAEPSAPPAADAFASAVAHLVPGGAVDEAYWLRVRAEFNLRDRLTWLNTGTFGPSPRLVPETFARIGREQAEDPGTSARAKEREATRAALAKLIAATPEETIITRSTTEGVNIFAHGLDWRAGDEVVMATHEHPGGYGAYRTLAERHGVKIRWVDLPAPPAAPEQIVDLYARAITRKTRVVFASHVMFINGTIVPVRALADLAHRNGCLISVDGAHTAGALPIDVKAIDCDHYAAAGQKWLMAGAGTGFSYLRRELQPKVWPLMSWTDPVEEKEDRASARKYETTGQRNMASIAALGAAVAFHQAIGPENVAARVRALGARLRDGLAAIPGLKLYTARDAALSAGITTFGFQDNGITSDNLAGALFTLHGMRASRQFNDRGPSAGWNSVRVCTHIFVMPDEVDRLIAAVAEIGAAPDKFRAMTWAAQAT
ncbi:MAG: aminotransferase class V-fold PLP-dependent enzyme [Rhodospirillaceae bacterium]|nr:aminotransferase class V-fold PLP-dependent enzyme [Rhodospirillaceae bacterium]